MTAASPSLLLLPLSLLLHATLALRDYPHVDVSSSSLLSSLPVCDVRKYGAVGDGRTVNTGAIQAAIDDCSAKQGVVLLSQSTAAGDNNTFVSGSLFLKSNLVFFVDGGVTLLGSPAKDNTTYPQVYTRVAGTMQYGHASLLNGARCQDISYNASAVGDQCKLWNKLQNITLAGSGTIDGNGDSGWWDKEYFNDRPTLLGLLWISTLTIIDLKLVNPPFWTVHPTFCNDVYVSNVTIVTTGPNNDGIDPDSTSNMLVENSYISTGDDCIAIKSGKDADGLAVAIPTQNIVIRNMVFGQGHGIAIGSEMSGNVINVTLTNLTLDGTQRGVRVKSQLGRGGIVSDITYEKMVIRNVQEAINVNEFYSSGATGVAPIFRNFLIQDIIADNVGQAGEFMCLSSAPCTGITVRNVTVTNYQKGYTCENAFGTSTDVSPSICLQ